jgi:hypothetical protein
MASHGASLRHAACLLALTSLTLICTSVAHADDADDYVACLIGRAAVAMHKQEKRDSGKALEVAYSQCTEPKDSSGGELEGLADYVNTHVEAMAR